VKKTLYIIDGETIEAVPFDLEWIGDLIYYEWPLLSVFANEFGEPFIKVWVDASLGLDRFILFKTTKRILEGYIIRELSFIEMLKNAYTEDYFAIDISKSSDEIEKVTKLQYTGFNKRYLPKENVKFQFGDQREIDNVLSFFSLNTDVEIYRYGSGNLIEVAKEKGQEVINIHLTSSNKVVGFGEIQSGILGDILVSYNKMAEAVVVRIHDTKTKASKSHAKRWRKGERDKVVSLSRTTFTSIAASFDIYLYPVRNLLYEDGETSTEQITNRIFDLFEMGTSLNFETQGKANFPQEMLTAYESLLKVIKENGLTMAVQYGNPIKEYQRRESFNCIKSSEIVKKLRAIEQGESVERKFTGKFRALNRKNDTFEFESTTRDIIVGSFDKRIREGIYAFVNLHSGFQILVSTYWESRSGRNEPIERNVILSYSKL